MTEHVLIIDGEETVFSSKKGKEAHRAYIEASRFDHVDKSVGIYLRMPRLKGDDTVAPDGTPSKYKWFTSVYGASHCEEVEKEIREERAEQELSACGDSPHS